MRTDRFNPAQHWRKSSQWFMLNRKCVAGSCAALQLLVLGRRGVQMHCPCPAPRPPARPASPPTRRPARRHAELVAHDTELVSVFAQHCYVGVDAELGR